ncbi:hypothetical protein S1OALGB6SA_739 [Olavius algarvensis spirochete endosymbiont]|uniref:DUF2259 domain-containing protein n=1 Tax=Olavius algarvensis spirochete endosymbiont TaxID=260710 RepID=UPI00052C4343|nr:DUF2259 domain-containing protein [Olavius algarvensis spirochete endosymbiont]KGM43200.1 hypothetical protein JY97_08855 [Alkalispirochaeta odontotermitis]VDA99668.1 hypothetical protein S1OALGB6SA_739 [Olavius algarvensis spirochete endosymbiont]
MKAVFAILLFTLSIPFVMAGELAILENLGFSEDARYFMFGQHMLQNDTGQAYAEIGVVEVPKNEFVPEGWKKGSWKVNPNQNSRGALYELLGASRGLKERYGVYHLRQGRLLYTRNNDDETLRGEKDEMAGTPALRFRDFERGLEFVVTLHMGNGETSRGASFYIELTTTDSNGAIAEYRVGQKGYMRPGVVSYRIDRIWCSSDGRSLVLAVAKEDEDSSISYMVETLLLR